MIPVLDAQYGTKLKEAYQIAINIDNQARREAKVTFGTNFDLAFNRA